MVLGLAVLDIRVCASPCRDCRTGEGRLESETTPPSGNGADSLNLSLNRKRKRSHSSSDKAAAGTEEKVVQCTFPPTLIKRISSERVAHTIMTYPEIIPHIEECVKLLEINYDYF